MYKLVVVGLNSARAEKSIQLQSTGDSTKYLAAVQTLLVNQVLGSMGGYPSYLKRWSRMGQVGASNLSALLKLGNIEAVVAVANTRALTSDLLQLTWWCATNTDQQAEIGRFLLSKPETLSQKVGANIAHYLLEFLPYEDDINILIDTTNLVLQTGLIPLERTHKLWQQGQRKPAFLVGFIERMPRDLPNLNHTIALPQSTELLREINTEQGQILLKTLSHILAKINQEHILYRTLEVLGKQFAHPLISPLDSIEQLQMQAENVGKTLGYEDAKSRARLFLAGISEVLVVSTISAHNLTGSAIRKKLATTLKPIQAALDVLCRP